MLWISRSLQLTLCVVAGTSFLYVRASTSRGMSSKKLGGPNGPRNEGDRTSETFLSTVELLDFSRQSRLSFVDVQERKFRSRRRAILQEPLIPSFPSPPTYGPTINPQSFPYPMSPTSLSYDQQQTKTPSPLSPAPPPSTSPSTKSSTLVTASGYRSSVSSSTLNAVSTSFVSTSYTTQSTATQENDCRVDVGAVWQMKFLRAEHPKVYVSRLITAFTSFGSRSPPSVQSCASQCALDTRCSLVTKSLDGGSCKLYDLSEEAETDETDIVYYVSCEPEVCFVKACAAHLLRSRLMR